MTSMPGSNAPSPSATAAEGVAPAAPAVARPVRRAAVIARHDIVEPLERLGAVAREAGVELGARDPDLVVVLGGDGTMLSALKQFLGRGIPAVGVNFGRVGFLASMPAADLEQGLRRVFAGDFRVTELPTLELETRDGRHVAVNDIVATSSTLGRMVDIAWSLGDEDLGTMSCDGIVCSTPSGSTAYNLSNGGPVLVWGLDAMAITFVAPHSLHARPLVAGRGSELGVRNATVATALTLIVDGVPVGELEPGASAAVRLNQARSLLATLPEATFFRRYRDTFGS
jgi:NAD+ kinase